jgi:hypothetical protein
MTDDQSVFKMKFYMDDKEVVTLVIDKIDKDIIEDVADNIVKNIITDWENNPLCDENGWEGISAMGIWFAGCNNGAVV